MKKKTKQREEQESKLMDCILEESTIECDHCHIEYDVYLGRIDCASDWFYNMGWRVDKDGYAIGPKCVRRGGHK